MSPKAKFVRKAKAERHNLKFWAEGVRETEILLPRLPEYMDALAQGWRAERACLDSICNEFHVRIPWTVGDNEEPEELLPYDKYAPVVEEELTDDERKAKFARIELLNARIQRWLKYRAHRTTNKFSRANVSFDSPFTRLFYRMRCIKRPPKACSLVQQFFHEENDRLVAPEVARIVAARKLAADGADDDEPRHNGKPKKKKTVNINDRMNIARELMEKMFDEDTAGTVKAGYEHRRRAESASALAAWTHLKTVGYPTDADWRDKAINEIREFITEVFKEIHAMTGVRIFCLMGGPVLGLPENDPFATIAISVGKNNAPRPVGFPRFDSKRYNDELIPFFKQYLKTCFTAEDIRKAQKPEHGGPDIEKSTDSGAASLDILKTAKYVLDDDEEDDTGYQTDNSITSVSDVFSDVGEDSTRLKSKGKGKAKAKAKPVATARAKTKVPVTRNRAQAAAAASQTTESMAAVAAAKQKAVDDTEKAIREAAAKKAEAQERAIARREEAAKEEAAALVAYAKSDEGRAEAARAQAQKQARREEEEARRKERFARVGTPLGGTVFADLDGSGSASRGASPISDLMDIDDRDDRPGNLDDGEVSGHEDPPPTTDDDEQRSEVEMDIPPTVDDEQERSDVDMVSADDSEGECRDNRVQGRGKKRRRSSESESDLWQPFTVEIPDKAPLWLARAAKELAQADLGQQYRAAVSMLVKLETLYEFQDMGRKLTTVGRPPQLAAWFKNDRKWSDKPGIRIKSLSDYDRQWKDWWGNLEPAWRKSGKLEGTSVSANANGRVWESMQAPGKLGMLQVVVALNCWGRELVLQGLPLSSGYEQATADVLWALTELKRDAPAAAPRLQERPKPKPAACG
ncbi:hypothetical protein C8F01DRAFT_1084004 [Mycena amicta]|nr:hypothetical protein C8F01DRAFT_1084004 [Mycena amicta]